MRVLARHPVSDGIAGDDVEVVTGDVRDAGTLDVAMAGVDAVVSAMSGFGGRDPLGTRAVDRDGNLRLIDAARAAGVSHFVLLSIHQAAADHPMLMLCDKWAAEEALRASGLSWTIIRPTAYLETWLGLLGVPLATSGTTRVFGRGRNPINFVSAVDVAEFVKRAIVEPDLRGTAIEVPGPQNLTLDELARVAGFRDRPAGPYPARSPGRDASGPSRDSPIQARAQRTNLGCAGDGRARHERRWSVPARRLPVASHDDGRRCRCPDVRLGSGCAQSQAKADRMTAHVRSTRTRGRRGRGSTERLRGSTRPRQRSETGTRRRYSVRAGPSPERRWSRTVNSAPPGHTARFCCHHPPRGHVELAEATGVVKPWPSCLRPGASGQTAANGRSRIVWTPRLR